MEINWFLMDNNNRLAFFITEEAKETVLDFPHGTVVNVVAQLNFLVLYNFILFQSNVSVKWLNITL